MVDWMRALDDKVVTPKPGIDAQAEPAHTTDEEIEVFREALTGVRAFFGLEVS